MGERADVLTNSVLLVTQRAGLLSRLAAIIYDSLQLIAVLFLATALTLPLTGGEAIPPNTPSFTVYLLLVCFVFFGWFWTHGGQTLGMRAWRLRIQQPNGAPITWRQAVIRFVLALLSWGCLGLGFWWIAFDQQGRGWHDLGSGTLLVKLPRS
jgi:uncharacterized RDD family membrane protein YckC